MIRVAKPNSIRPVQLLQHYQQLHRVVKEYVRYYNSVRPHQGISQAIPEVAPLPVLPDPQGEEEKIISFPTLGGLHHDYRRVA